jgi:hypothetical protein
MFDRSYYFESFVLDLSQQTDTAIHARKISTLAYHKNRSNHVYCSNWEEMEQHTQDTFSTRHYRIYVHFQDSPAASKASRTHWGIASRFPSKWRLRNSKTNC